MSFIYFYLLIIVHPYLAMWWRSFPLAGRQSWEALIPIYNYFVAYRVFCKKGWWVVLLIFPGVHLVMWSVINVSYVRRFGYLSLVDTIQGIFFPYLLFAKIASNGDQMLPETNWANSKEAAQREWGDHLVLFLSLPILGHVIALGIAAVTREKPGARSKVKEWGDSIIFALVAASIIRTYVFEPFRIPTGSMERTLLVGDFLFVNKLAYGPKVPVTPLSYPLVHNTFPWINVQSYTTLEKGSYTRLPGFGQIQRNDVMVFNYPAGDTAVYDPRMPNGLMGHEYEGIVIKQARKMHGDQLGTWPARRATSLRDSLKRLDIEDEALVSRLIYEDISKDFLKNIDEWKRKARTYIADGKTWSEGEGVVIEHKGIIYRPVDKRENYIKRCVGIPGDYIELKSSILYVNDQPAFVAENQNLLYEVDSINFASYSDLYKNFGLEYADLYGYQQTGNIYGVFTNLETIKRLRAKYEPLGVNFTVQLRPKGILENGKYSPIVRNENLDYFPKDPNICNTVSDYTRIQIPYKGKVVDFTKEDIAWYRRIITAYEGHTLQEKADGIYIDGKKTTTYKVEMNYYWLMGDNRYNSADSRVWGFVPEDHVVGKASMVWFSSSSDYGVRWERLFKVIR